jgi:4-hydroxy-tetrahydrodipicolinate reductase
MDTIILGDGGLGRAIAAELRARGEPEPRVRGRPTAAGHPAGLFNQTDVVFDASRGDGVASNVRAALDAGARRFVIATTGWSDDLPSVDGLLRAGRAAAVVAPNLSLGAAVFLRLVDRAAELFGAIDGFEPYVLEWHRRAKRDRPSGTALDIARRIRAATGRPDVELVSIRAGASPGLHRVGFDAPGETVELQLTARDRSAYAAGALVAADWLIRAPRSPGIHPFDRVVDELLARPALSATA